MRAYTTPSEAPSVRADFFGTETAVAIRPTKTSECSMGGKKVLRCHNPPRRKSRWKKNPRDVDRLSSDGNEYLRGLKGPELTFIRCKCESSEEVQKD